MLSSKDKHYAVITIADIRRALKILEDKLDKIAGVKKEYKLNKTSGVKK